MLGFCQRRGWPTDRLKIAETTHAGADGVVNRIDLDVQLPADFPAKYREAVVRAADQCTVKKHLLHPPTISITTHVLEPAQAA